jgi:hypothetical protein
VKRLVIKVCRREKGKTVLPVERGGRPRRLDAGAIHAQLETLIARRKLWDYVRVSDACAGGCGMAGPNISVIVYPPIRPGEKPDHVAMAWKTYVASLDSLDCLSRVIDENLR